MMVAHSEMKANPLTGQSANFRATLRYVQEKLLRRGGWFRPFL
jgi:hypothetical protein